MPAKHTRADAEALIALFKECDGELEKIIQKSGLTSSAIRYRRLNYKQQFPDLEIPPIKRAKKVNAYTDEQLQQVANMYALHGRQAAAARAMGLDPSTFRYMLERAEQEGITASIRGNSEAQKPRHLPLPPKGKVKRYILTCAQNDTFIEDEVWQALMALKKHYGAEMMVATLTYVHSQEGSAKRGTGKRGSEQGMWYDDRITPFIADEMIALAPSLVWNGNMNILPTAVDPLAGLENYNFRASSIFPHTKVALRSIPTVRADAAKFQYTTGTVTKRNYIQRKSGQKAEFDHVYGGLLVEVNHEGHWWARQLNVDSRGYLYDLDVCVLPSGKVVPSPGVEAIQFGDIHVAQLEDDMLRATWGPGGMVASLKPRYQFMHDILDFESRSHHNLRDPFKMFELHVRGRDSVRRELEDVSRFLGLATLVHPSEIVIVQSNHDLHFEKWLKETSWKTDPLNAEIHAAATTAWISAIRNGEPFNALRWGLDYVGHTGPVTWVDGDEGFVILKDEAGGIEMGLHGDRGPNGARGSIRNLSRLGRKVCIGHSHSAAIVNGAYQSGVKARLNMDYARGAPSSWSQTDIVVHPNGKRQLITWWRGRYRA